MDLHYVQGESVFIRTNKVPKQYPYLTEDIETEVAVIGGGVTGAIIGYYMNQAGIACAILEKERIAYGSTSITTALLQYELDSNARELEQYTPLENVIRSYELGLKALDEVEHFIKTYGNTCAYEKRDTLLYTNRAVAVTEMREEYEVRKAAGLPVDFITEETNPFSFDLKGGVYAREGGAQLDPYQYTHHLLEVSYNNGLAIYENTEVIHINYLAEGVEIETSYGYKVRAKKVVVATGYNTDRFTSRSFGTKTVTYNIATEPVSTLKGWENKVLIRDNNDPYHYYRTTQDNRILAGGEDIPFNPGIFDEKAAQESYDKLEQKIKMMFPGISDIKRAYGYCGAFASTQDNLGFVGPCPEHQHLWFCLGYGANGILFAILGGMMLTQLYRGEVDDALELFRVDRFDGKKK